MATHARQQYFADESSLSKEKREFSIAEEVQQKIDSIEEGAQVNTIETIKVNGAEVEPDENKAIDLTIPGVVDGLDSISSTDALSAKQGKVLYDYIQDVSHIGHFLALWDASTGLPVTNPEVSPYVYNTGDFYTVSNVAPSGGTNYRPDGTQYVIGQASTTVDTDSVAVNDFYFYDGTTWRHMKNSGAGSIAIDGSLSTTSTNPVENRVITNALNGKADAIDVNTKTFYLSSTSDLTNAQAAYDWYLSGKNPIIRISGYKYSFILEGNNSEPTYHLGFYGVDGEVYNGTSSSSIGINPRLELRHSSDTITSVVVISYNTNTLLTNVNYSTPYTPQYDGSPATKKYVDDNAGKTYIAGANIQISAQNVISATDTKYTAGTGISIDANNVISNTQTSAEWGNITGTLSNQTDLQTALDAKQDDMVILKYGISTWNDFITAYQKNGVVYCRASSNTNPATGTQGRLAFMAYVNNADNPTEVEFQYYRSRSDHNSAANQLDEVYVYKLVPASGGTWTVTQRNTAAKAVAGTGINLAFGSGNMTISADTSVLATKTDLNSKQDTLVSGTNIKTINSNSLLGSGNLTLNDVKSSATTPSSPTEGMVWYDTTNDQLKVYDGTNWNVVGDDSADVNTKTFYLSSTSDLTNAQAAYDWINSGKTAIVKLTSRNYIITDLTSSYVTFRSTDIQKTGNSYSNAYTSSSQQRIKFNLSSGSVTSIDSGFIYIVPDVLATNINYSSPYNPLYPGSPATKKYVDDTVASAGFQLAPNSPLTPKYRRYGTQAQYDALTQYYTEVAGDTVYFTI